MVPKNNGNTLGFIKRQRGAAGKGLVTVSILLGCLLLSVAWKGEPMQETFDGWIV